MFGQEWITWSYLLLYMSRGMPWCALSRIRCSAVVAHALILDEGNRLLWSFLYKEGSSKGRGCVFPVGWPHSTACSARSGYPLIHCHSPVSQTLHWEGFTGTCCLVDSPAWDPGCSTVSVCSVWTCQSHSARSGVGSSRKDHERRYTEKN